MSFGSDIHVFICMRFVLVELFDEWVYSFYNGGYLSDEVMMPEIFNKSHSPHMLKTTPTQHRTRRT